MKKKIFLVTLFVISIISIKLNVNAANTYATSSSDADYNTLKSSYDTGITKTSISSSDTVTLYGTSNCNGSSCTYNYVGNNSSFETVLSKSVICTNGEKYISYQSTGEGGKKDFMTDNKAGHTGVVYWSEDYYVTCVSNNSGSTTVTLANTTVGESSNTNNNYNSSSTVKNEQTGVNTYFVILGLVAVISYVFMIFVKKFNLFKKI